MRLPVYLVVGEVGNLQDDARFFFFVTLGEESFKVPEMMKVKTNFTSEDGNMVDVSADVVG